MTRTQPARAAAPVAAAGARTEFVATAARARARRWTGFAAACATARVIVEGPPRCAGTRATNAPFFAAAHARAIARAVTPAAAARAVMAAAALVLACALPASAGPAADGWRGFYTPSAPARAVLPLDAIPPRDAVPPARHGDPCLEAILTAEARFGIPDNLLVAMGYLESGRSVGGRHRIWPWTVNAGGRGHYLDTRAAAENLVARARGNGTASVDVGCLQVNLKWHPGAFASLAEAFDPTANAAYAARFLARLRAETGSWDAAAGAYHSRTPEHAARYRAALADHLAATPGRLAAAGRGTRVGAARFAVAAHADRLPALSKLSAARPDAVDLPRPASGDSTPPPVAARGPVPPAMGRPAGPIWGASMDGRRDAVASTGSLFGGPIGAPVGRGPRGALHDDLHDDVMTRN